MKPIRTVARRTLAATAFLVAMLCRSAPAAALPIEATVGTGPNTANIVVEFEDGAAFQFEVLFAGISISGIDAMTTLDAALTGFDIVLLDFGAFGFAMDGVTYTGHSNVGFGGGELFWHYWTRASGNDPWSLSDVGASFRQLGDGAFDGWKYNALAPVPEPGTAVLVGLGLVGLGWKRRRPRATRVR